MIVSMVGNAGPITAAPLSINASLTSALIVSKIRNATPVSVPTPVNARSPSAIIVIQSMSGIAGPVSVTTIVNAASASSNLVTKIFAEAISNTAAGTTIAGTLSPAPRRSAVNASVIVRYPDAPANFVQRMRIA